MMKERKNIRRFLTVGIALILIFFTITPVMAEDGERPTADLSIAVLSQYIWRGQELSKDSVVIQPSMTIGYKGFSANLWGNTDTDPYTASDEEDEDNNWNETDFTLSYGKSFGILGVEGGYIYYGLEDGCDDSQELFLSLGLDTLLSPSLTVYKDIDSYPHWYFLLGISHSFTITEKVALELSASVSYLKSEDEDEYPEISGSGLETNDKFDDFHDGVISASLPVPVGEYFTVTPTVSYTFPLSGNAGDEMEWRSKNGDDDSFVYGGVIVSMAF